MSLLHFQFYTRGDSKAKSKHSRKISLNLDCVEWMGLSETCSVLRDLSSLHVGGWNRSLPKCINEAYDFMYAMKKKIFWFAHSMRFFEKKNRQSLLCGSRPLQSHAVFPAFIYFLFEYINANSTWFMRESDGWMNCTSGMLLIRFLFQGQHQKQLTFPQRHADDW